MKRLFAAPHAQRKLGTLDLLILLVQQRMPYITRGMRTWVSNVELCTLSRDQRMCLHRGCLCTIYAHARLPESLILSDCFSTA